MHLLPLSFFIPPEEKMAYRLLYCQHMNMTAQYTSQTGSLAATSQTAGSYTGKKESAAAKTDFDMLIDMAASAPKEKSAAPSSSPDCKDKEVTRKAGNNTNETTETASAQTAQKPAQNTQDSSTAPAASADAQSAQQPAVNDEQTSIDAGEQSIETIQSLSPDTAAVILQALVQQAGQSSTEPALSAGEEQTDPLLQIRNIPQPAPAEEGLENNTAAPDAQNTGDVQRDAKNASPAGDVQLDTTEAPSATEISAAWTQGKSQDAAGKQTPVKKEGAPAPSAPEQQIPDNHTSPVSQKSASVEKSINFTESSVSGESTLQNGTKVNQDTAQLQTSTVEPQTKADISHQINQETAAMQQPAQNTKNTTSSAANLESTLSAVRTQNIFDPAENKATIISTGNRLAVSLEPEGLGKLNINLSLDRGMVNAQIQAADPAAKNLLESNMQQIMDTLMREGLNVGGFSVSLKHGETGDMNGQGANDSGKPSAEENTNMPNTYQNEPVGRISMFV